MIYMDSWFKDRETDARNNIAKFPGCSACVSSHKRTPVAFICPTNFDIWLNFCSQTIEKFHSEMTS